MLILSRKSGQSFQIGEEIRVTITEITSDRVKIGIDAPKTLRVLRDELRQTMTSNQQAAGSVAPDALRALAANLQLSSQERPGD